MITIKYAPGSLVAVQYITPACYIDRAKIYDDGSVSYHMVACYNHDIEIGWFDEDEIVGVVD